MDQSKPILPTAIGVPTWRYVAFVVLIVGPLLWAMNLDPIAQNTEYHSFADTREFFGIPNFLDVITNLPFLLIGLLGLRFCFRAEVGAIRSAWIILFAGVGLVSVGSAYYHWNLNNTSLVWDRLPMTIGFMGLFVALLGEYLGNRIAALLLFPAVALGLATVVYWHFSDDLPTLLLGSTCSVADYPRRNGSISQWLLSSMAVLLVALGWYVLAKFTESYDVAIFRGTQELISGHSLKHLLAGAGCYSILLMLRRRKATL
jgi:hypothetical protein